MKCNFIIDVSHSCKSVAQVGSWILDKHLYWEFGVGNTHIDTQEAN